MVKNNSVVLSDVPVSSGLTALGIEPDGKPGTCLFRLDGMTF